MGSSALFSKGAPVNMAIGAVLENWKWVDAEEDATRTKRCDTPFFAGCSDPGERSTLREMNEITNRNYDIAAAVIAGEALSALGERYGLHISSIRRIAQDNASTVRRCGDRQVPAGLTVRAAVAIQDVTGIWPTEADAAEIADRWHDFLRAPTHRPVRLEITSWLDATIGSAVRNQPALKK